MDYDDAHDFDNERDEIIERAEWMAKDESLGFKGKISYDRVIAADGSSMPCYEFDEVEWNCSEDSIVETMNESKSKPGVGTFIVACVGILSTLTGCGIFTIKKLRA